MDDGMRIAEIFACLVLLVLVPSPFPLFSSEGVLSIRGRDQARKGIAP